MDTLPHRRWSPFLFAGRIRRFRGIHFVWLSVIAVVLFAITFFFERAYAQRQQQMSVDWFERGQQALSQGQPKDAVTDLRTALIYSHQNQQYLFALGRALEADHRIPEARAYFLSLLDQQPGSGPVNLELAHLEANSGDVNRAMRYFNAAVYGAWESDPVAQREQVRKEFIGFLTDKGFTTQARGELLTLSAEMTKSPQSDLWLAQAFGRLGDDRNALGFYDASLRVDRRNPDALFGAGQAAFRLEQYRQALRYFRRAAAVRDDANTQRMLQLTSMVLDMNPFESALSVKQRKDRLVLSMDVADRRLRQCEQGQHVPLNAAQTAAVQTERMQWMQLDRQLRQTRTDASLWLGPITQLINSVEQQTACGPFTDTDKAVQLIYENAELQP